jgi:hypothetical protein
MGLKWICNAERLKESLKLPALWIEDIKEYFKVAAGSPNA